ncbi:CAAX prenyl protease 2 [Vanrija pseudolonga]|uniref:intramembrane prenyl-peptidase Rce1 n=1 Tax=Vanrija pseudolonga TaxID=143232 RepID=A0AAF0Y3H3_9TREE|nr:CAAX prenyl protease 2 [Vanrija pseudolonga]
MLAIDPHLALPAPLATGINASTAHALALVFASSYVGSLYVSQAFFARRDAAAAAEGRAEPSEYPLGHRDHPTTMRRRMAAVKAVTRLSLAGVWATVARVGAYSARDSVRPTLALLGLSNLALNRPLAYLLAPILFTGPLYEAYLDAELPGQANWKWQFGLVEKRNYVVGPVSEELLFRSAILAVSLLGHLPASYLVFGSPLWFGVAHVHHAFQTYRASQRTRRDALIAAVRCVFQFGYTTLFGWFASFVYLRTGSVFPAIASHIFCNIMGLPAPSASIAEHPQKKKSIIAAYLVGIAGFIYGIRRL